jgi:beta-lactamase class A
MQTILDYLTHFIISTTLTASSFMGWSFFGQPTSTNTQLPAPVEHRINTTPQYSLINPLIFIDTDQHLFTEYNDFDKQVESYVKDAKNKGIVNSVSVYVRDMNSGHWTGTDENELYEPGSMLKVAVLITYLRYAMDQSTLHKTIAKDILSQQLYYPGADETGQYYTSSHSALVSGMYTYQQLLEHMIIDSDNTALQVLLKDQRTLFQNVYNDFRLPPSPAGQDDDFMTVKSYSVIFRSLFNASYLLRSASEQALELLSKTTFTDGLVSGVASSTMTIAHKFGERTYQSADGTILNRELHDCGIVYYPYNPYFICVMTKGKGEYPALAQVISDISKIAYAYVDHTISVQR